MYKKDLINEVLNYTRNAISGKISVLIEEKGKLEGAYTNLYHQLADYPFRKGKALRPALCISVARAAGGLGNAALFSATALELYHNAFLIHDDIEDESEVRRGKNTLHELLGVARAINIGDATNVLAMSLLLENIKAVGVGKALGIISEIENMALQSVEGQSMELDWVADKTYDLDDRDYFQMCGKKTCWYSFISPCRIGYTVGVPYWKENNHEENLQQLTDFGMDIGIAFQIQDDVLNLIGEHRVYGKEICGDLFEGKRTLMLNHVIKHAGKDASRIQEIMATPRSQKNAKDVEWILAAMHAHGSIRYAKEIAAEMANRALSTLHSMSFLSTDSPKQPGEIWQCKNSGYEFLQEIVHYVISREL